MDLIGQLASTLGVPTTAAEAVAGTVLGGVKGALADDGAASAQLDRAVPELSNWQAAATSLMGGGGAAGLGGLLGGAGGGAGGLLGAAAGALGGSGAGDAAALAGVIAKLGLSADKAALVAPIALAFLKERLDPALLSKVLAAAPLLTGESAGALGALGSLFGR